MSHPQQVMVPFEDAIWRWFEKNAGVVKNRHTGNGSDACLHRSACSRDTVSTKEDARRSICAFSHASVPEMFSHGRNCGWKYGSRNGYPKRLPTFCSTFSWTGTDCFDPTPSLESYLACNCGEVSALLGMELAGTVGDVIAAVVKEGEGLGPPMPEAHEAVVLTEKSGYPESVFVPLICGHQRVRINIPDTFSDEPTLKKCSRCHARYSVILMKNGRHARVTRT